MAPSPAAGSGRSRRRSSIRDERGRRDNTKSLSSVYAGWDRWVALQEAARAGDEDLAASLHADVRSEMELVRPIRLLADARAYDEAAQLVPLLFRHEAAFTLNETCALKLDVDRRAVQLRVTNSARSASLIALSERLELTMKTLLATLDDEALRSMFFTVEGERFMRSAVMTQCGIVIEEARVHYLYDQVWHGRLLTKLSDSRGPRTAVLALALLTVLNLPLLPLVCRI